MTARDDRPVVEMRIWGVDRVVPAVRRVARSRRDLMRLPGLGFGTMMGTGSARTFTPRDADLHHWALLTVWKDARAASAAASATAIRAWDSACTEQLRVTMRPLTSRGRWARREPFGRP